MCKCNLSIEHRIYQYGIFILPFHPLIVTRSIDIKSAFIILHNILRAQPNKMTSVMIGSPYATESLPNDMVNVPYNPEQPDGDRAEILGIVVYS